MCMAKKIRFLIVFCSLIILSSTAFAAFEKLYMVDANGSNVEKNVFDWSETPWLYLKLPVAEYNVTSSWWTSPSDQYFYTSTTPSSYQELWLTLNNWTTLREVGLWKVSALYYYANNPCDEHGVGYTSFTVTPEPLGCALFAVGGIALALFRKKRKSTA